ncbi:MAG: VWA domain-containing protein [Crocinitomicaceae bacterium]|nr:VWA domain-containing protein [Crocinitomicaceae bacterium]
MTQQILLFILFFAFNTNAQISFNTTKHDFGELEPYSPRYVDLTLKNTGDKQEWVLSVKKPFEVIYITSKQIIEKDSTTIIRLQVNPKKKGRFSYNVNIFTSDKGEPTVIKLTGNLTEVVNNGSGSFTSCPNFSDRPGGKNPNNFDLTVVTVDKETRETLSKSKVTMIQSGRPIWVNETDKKGKIKEESTLGLSYFYATHNAYKPAELGAYINFKRNYIIIELEKDPIIENPIIPIEDTAVVAITPPETSEETIIEINEQLDNQLAEEIDSTLLQEAPPAFAELDPNNFDEEYFNPVNVVFVLDVSSSMKQVDKIELMKYALFQLTDMIRPQDKIGIVTYASDARVLLKPTSGADKEAIKKEVGDLKAFGYTSGGSGIKLGFKQAKRGEIIGGANHVIVITDGAFNRNSKDYKKYVKKYRRKGITMSVVGIKNKSVDEEKMVEAATLGGGNYIPIFKLADAKHNLKHEIRLLTFKHK